MQKEIKCPQCGGNRFNESGNNSYLRKDKNKDSFLYDWESE